MNLKVPIILFTIGIIVAFWPGAGLLLKVVSSSLILTFAGLPLIMKKRDFTLISIALTAIVFGVFYFVKTSGGPASIEAFMKNKNDFDVRYADVEELSKQFGHAQWLPYFLKWEGKCLHGDVAYCRIASYVPRVKREKRAEDLLRLGCTSKDFLSCYNYFFYEEFGAEDRAFAKTTILAQCKASDLSLEFKDICHRVSQK